MSEPEAKPSPAPAAGAPIPAGKVIYLAAAGVLVEVRAGIAVKDASLKPAVAAMRKRLAAELAFQQELVDERRQLLAQEHQDVKVGKEYLHPTMEAVWNILYVVPGGIIYNKDFGK